MNKTEMKDLFLPIIELGDGSITVEAAQQSCKLYSYLSDALNRDAKDAARLFGSQEARYFVDLYYSIQKTRIRVGNQIKATLVARGEKADKQDTGDEAQTPQAAEPNYLFQVIYGEFLLMEERAKQALHEYAKGQDKGRWLLAQTGIGPVLAAGIMAHINEERAKNAGSVWRFAGFDPNITWEKGQVRPYNQTLKTLGWKVADSMLKQKGRDACYYGKIYDGRKAYEMFNNVTGKYRRTAQDNLTRKFGPDSETYWWNIGAYRAVKITEDSTEPIPTFPEWAEAWEKREKDAEARKVVARYAAMNPVDFTVAGGLPMLSPYHIHMRSLRLIPKMLFSHYFDIAFFLKFGTPPPLPEVFDEGQHKHFCMPPQAHLVDGYEEARLKTLKERGYEISTYPHSITPYIVK